ncbi:MAG: DUF805 domain-containing protein [Paludibacteraceae bacterium]|nr:DUF805 domain-containing protein [Paludibacteraceae bacterium]
MDWYIKGLKNYTEFEGRARRKEYWMFILIHSIVLLALTFLFILLFDTIRSIGVVATLFPYFIYVFASFAIIPTISVTIRRLHDVNKSGWHFFNILKPIVGIIWLLVLLFKAGDKGDNKYGPDPKAIEF